LHETNVFLALESLGLQVCVIRPSVVFGKKQSPGMLVPSIIQSLSNAEPFFLNTPADVRDFLHVDDLADLILRSATSSKAPLGVLNGARGESNVVLEVAWELCDRIGVPRSLIKFKSRDDISAEPIQRFKVDKAFEVLGWKPSLTLRDGIERTLNG
jgi:nucleoside-diphosphate-sugar epimerase